MNETNNFIVQNQINRCIELLEKENFSEARKFINNLKKEKKTKNIGLFLNGILHIKQKEETEAKKYFNKFCRINRYPCC